MASSSSEIFYGIYVNTFTLSIASESVRYSSRQNNILDIIFLRNKQGRLEVKEGASDVLSRVPKEIWQIIKTYVIQDGLKRSKKALVNNIFSDCEMLTFTDAEDFMPPMPGEIDSRGNIAGCLDFGHAYSEYATACEICSEKGVDFYYYVFASRKLKTLDNLLGQFGLRLVNEDQFCHQRLMARQGDFQSLTALTLKRLPQFSFPGKKRHDESKHSYRLAFEPISPQDQPLSFPTDDEKFRVIRQFKSLVDSYGIMTKPFVSGEIIPQEEECIINMRKGGKGFDGSEPRWIKSTKTEQEYFDPDESRDG